MTEHAITLLVWCLWVPGSLAVIIGGSVALWRELRELDRHPLVDLRERYRRR